MHCLSATRHVGVMVSFLIGAVAAASGDEARPAKPDPPPLRMALASDSRFQAAYDDLLKSEPSADSPGHVCWLQRTLAVAFYVRNYEQGEACARQLLISSPDDWSLHDELSLMLGKQGKYQEALSEADIALALPDADPLHLTAIKASWLYHLGRREEAKDLFASLEVPPEGTPAWALYQGCRACFSASSHNIPELKKSIFILMKLGGSSAYFVQRDEIFDQYRHLEWFCQLVGNTLAPTL